LFANSIAPSPPVDDAIGVVALPRPHDLPGLSGSDHTGITVDAGGGVGSAGAAVALAAGAAAREKG
jgi:hypothetical protein